jgi:phosphopantetheinyl transferase
VDVESRASDLTPNDCAAIFRPQELAAILAAPDRGSELIRRFTIKEAVLKAQGVGFLGDPLTVETTRPEEKIKPTKTRAAQIDRPDHLAYGHLDLAPDFWLTWAGSWSSRPRPLTFLGLKAWLF